MSAQTGKELAPTRPPRKKRVPCPVLGCSQRHALDNCLTFRDMTPKQRLDMAHQKQLCLFCLRHPMGMECWTLNKWPNCTVEGCGKPHHEMLHEVLKVAGGSGWGPRPDDVPEAEAARRIGNRSRHSGSPDKDPRTRGAGKVARRRKHRQSGGERGGRPEAEWEALRPPRCSAKQGRGS